MRKSILLICVLCLGALLSEMKGQTATFKALFLYNFTKNIDWPAEANGSDLVITILGDDDVSAELEKIAKVKKAGNKSIKIVQARSVKEVGDSHIVFLGAAKSALMQTLSYEQQDKPVLLVADKGGLCKQGAGISFVTISGKLRYEICPALIESHNLKVTQKIISLGIEVQ
ncbi:YfiR family protein [Carboxylicivirga mesophila]|uniref:YfiR family protein n=1 Tax=Carboxylicivirga mesophila TaxID=1166478 RepID=A0ABS5K4A3_9BACT|nr:YfiR family protein [Carboxylicivirga mesophila]MBS2209856.1 YfiR family protein [Carboxylicivirga mesophila]